MIAKTLEVSANDKVIRPIVAVNIKEPRTGTSEIIYAVLDTGADKDYISIALAERLMVKMTMTPMEVVGFGSVSREERPLGNLSIESLDGQYRANVKEALIGDFPQNLRSRK